MYVCIILRCQLYYLIGGALRTHSFKASSSAQVDFLSASLVTEKEADVLMVKLHGRGVNKVCLGTLLCVSTKLLKDKATIMHLSCCLVLKSNKYICIRSVAQLFVTNYIIFKPGACTLVIFSVARIVHDDCLGDVFKYRHHYCQILQRWMGGQNHWWNKSLVPGKNSKEM